MILYAWVIEVCICIRKVPNALEYRGLNDCSSALGYRGVCEYMSGVDSSFV